MMTAELFPSSDVAHDVERNPALAARTWQSSCHSTSGCARHSGDKSCGCGAKTTSHSRRKPSHWILQGASRCVAQSKPAMDS